MAISIDIDRARLLEVVPGPSGQVTRDWISQRPDGWVEGIGAVAASVVSAAEDPLPPDVTGTPNGGISLCMHGGTQADVLNGGDDSDTLRANEGNDFLTCGTGGSDADIAYGGPGGDALAPSAPQADWETWIP